MLGGLKAWFSALSTAAKVGAVTAVVATGGVASAALQSPTNYTTKTTVPVAKTVKAVCIAKKTTSSETQSIPFDKTTVDDPSSAKGQTSIKTTGVNGVKTQTFEDTTYSPSGCQQDTNVLTKEEVTTQPVTEVTAVGTYVASVQPTCSNGTYVNSAGNTVCSPYSAPSAPAGATAQCVDGTYSFSQTHSGTCSHHGGVTQWL
jgi:hypothetical protein